MVFPQQPLAKGYNLLTEEFGIHKDMMMDIGVYVFQKGEEKEFIFQEKESAYLLLNGNIQFIWGTNQKQAERKSLFDEKPTCLHVSKGIKVIIKAFDEAEVLIQKTTNPKEFDSVYYSPESINEIILGDNVWQNTARRMLRDIFTYDNAPYSNMVMGEIINLAGRWSSYPPHHHRQPEVYYYRFDKPQGFGCSIIGDEIYKITDGSISTITGGLCHPQLAAPGYPMYYCWMIRHFDNDPWTERIFDPAHEWLLEKNPEIWEPKC